MRLSRQTLRDITSRSCIVSEESRVQLSEKVSQFGTGMLLPGLPDYFFGKANRKGIFNGRVVVIKSTSKVDTSSFDKQGGLFTLCIHGLKERKSKRTCGEQIFSSSLVFHRRCRKL